MRNHYQDVIDDAKRSIAQWPKWMRAACDRDPEIQKLMAVRRQTMKTDREQLLELRDDLSRQIGFESARFRGKSAEYVLRLIDRLLARFPYDDGETILVGATEPVIKREFVAIDPSGGVLVRCDNGQIARYDTHRSMPVTRTLEVPEEIIEAAHELKTSFLNSEKAAMVIEWFAREAGK